MYEIHQVQEERPKDNMATSFGGSIAPYPDVGLCAILGQLLGRELLLLAACFMNHHVVVSIWKIQQ